MITFLDAVNKVLLRLREPTVDTVQGSGSSNLYARMIGEFINEAKAQVETSWDWSALRSTISANTQADVYSYELNNTKTNVKVLNVLNDTSNYVMQYQSGQWFDEQFLLHTNPKGSPVYYNFNGVSADGDIMVDIFPIPDGVYNLRFNVTLRNPELSADTDTIIIPHRPIILLATAMAIEERGEDGGQQSINAYASSQRALADEIAMDAARHEEDTIWYQV
jgi:hypothetical protein